MPLRTHRAPVDRRTFLKATGAAAAFLAALEAAPEKVEAAIPAAPTAALAPSWEPNDDVLTRMHAELQTALQKPADQRRWVMVIDLRKCVGCHACTVACVAENKLPPGVVYRPVLSEEMGTYPNVTMRFLPKPCMQCDEPPCVPVCPVGATYKAADGIVAVDYDQCIGCRYCINACPYFARTFDFGNAYLDGSPTLPGVLLGKDSSAEYTRAASFEYGEARQRLNAKDSPVGNVRKCHFCLHRLQEGMLPACTSTCIGRATFFGDANDPDSLVASLVASPNVMRLKEELGTQPRVFYLA